MDDKHAFHVYHAVEPTFRGVVPPRHLPGFERVAIVTASTLDEVYALTQHLSQPWERNEGVFPIGAKFRSTSVGDVIRSHGRQWVVMPVGFVEF